MSSAVGYYRRLRQFGGSVAGFGLLSLRDDDSFVVAYPRSGSTWARTVIANILCPEAPSNPDVFNRLIPSVSYRFANRVRALPSPRILKSHTPFRSGLRRLPRVAYLVRNGRDVLVSLFHYEYARKRGDRGTTFEDFFSRYCKHEFGPLWHEHVESWLDVGQKMMGERLFVLRFETLKQDPIGEFSRLLDHFGIRFTTEELETAVERGSIERMRRVERSRRGRVREGESFYRGGKTGQWRDYFSPEIERAFRERSRRAERLAGYVQDAGPPLTS